MTLKHCALLCALISSPVLAQRTTPLLVSVDKLSDHLQDRDLVLLHVGPKAEYEAKHIPGAHLVSAADIALPMDHSNPAELMLELPSPEVLRTKLANLGISDDSHVVVYFNTDQSFSSATRVVFTLQYAGLGDHTSFLNGGMAAWIAAGHPVTEAISPVTPGKLTLHPAQKIVADAELVRDFKQHPNYKLVDARSPVYYNGTEATYKKNGHIPGAVNIPFTDLADDKGLMDTEHIAQLFRAAGIKPGDTVVTYCHIGQQATVVVLGARLLGNPVMLYDGAFQDWAINNRGPVEK